MTAKDLVRGCRRLTSEPTAAWDEILRSAQDHNIAIHFTASQRSANAGNDLSSRRSSACPRVSP